MNKKIILIFITILLFVGGFIWVDYHSKKAEDIEGKVKEAIRYAVLRQQMEGERTLIKEQNSLPYYTPNFSNKEQQYSVFEKVVFDLNSEPSVPPVKLADFSMIQTSSIDIYVEVSYTGVLGIQRKFVIHTMAKVKAFKHESGPEAFN